MTSYTRAATQIQKVYRGYKGRLVWLNILRAFEVFSSQLSAHINEHLIHELSGFSDDKNSNTQSGQQSMTVYKYSPGYDTINQSLVNLYAIKVRRNNAHYLFIG